MKNLKVIGIRLIAVLYLTVSAVSLTLAQGVDTEPNNVCAQAQAIAPRPIALPFTVTGSLDTPLTNPDIDFLKFSVVPGSVVRVNYEGAPTNKGTLND